MSVELDPDTCHAALRARDRRFDGVFFVGVTSTGVYCRPICPARLPARQRCRYFARAAHAELAGFRACLRCRPELAPGRGTVDAVPALARAALARIDAGDLDERSVEALADRLGVTARHLRRAVVAELGASPLALAQTRRLAVAKQLLHDTRLPITDVAFAAGFASLRRFNAAFHARFGRPPTALRRATDAPAAVDDVVTLRLDHRPPLCWSALLAFLAARAIPGVEQVDDAGYRRTVALGDRVGWLAVRSLAPRPAVELTLSASLVPRLAAVVARVRALFDLDAHPAAIEDALRTSPILRGPVAARPGLRVPGGFDGFELAVRSVLGQQVSVAAATTLAGRLVAALGTPMLSGPGSAPPPAEGGGRWGTAIAGAPGGLTHVFPTAAEVAAAGPDAIARLGLPRQRALALVALARAVDGGLELVAGADPDLTTAALTALPGIGPWTASYLAMRALRWPDAFPAGDLIVQRALGVTTAAAAERAAAGFRPWRAYATVHLWAAHVPTPRHR